MTGRRQTTDAWSLPGIIGSCLSCGMRTLPVISTTSEYKQNAVSAVGAPWERRESAVRAQAIASLNAVWTPWSSVETQRSPWDRRGNTVRTPWQRHLQEQYQISLRSHGALGNLRTPCNRSGNAARCYRALTAGHTSAVYNNYYTRLLWQQ